MDIVCAGFSMLMQGLFWRIDFSTVAELLTVAAFFIVAFKVYRKRLSELWLSDFRLEIALLLPWALTRGVRAIFVFACWVE